MGIDFRGKGYVRRIRIGKRRVKDGEAAAVWDQYGRHKEVTGPALQRLWWSTIRFLERHVAEKNEYLRVQNRDGSIEHIRGPTALYENPVYHIGVSVEKAVALANDSSHLVVHRLEPKGKDEPSPKGAASATQLVVTGPKIFFPEPTDKLRKFQWNANGSGLAADPNVGNNRPREHSGFVVVSKAPVQRTLECSVLSGDDHSITVCVTIRATLLGLEDILAVENPIVECDAAVQVAVAEALSAMQLADRGSAVHTHVRQALEAEAVRNGLDTALRQRAACELVGLQVDNVQPSKELGILLRKEDELAEAKLKEQLADAALDAAAARQQREQQMEAAKQAHELKLAAERIAASHGSHDDEAKRAVDFLKDLNGMGVDLTKFLTPRVVHATNVVCNDPTLAVVSSQKTLGPKKAAIGWW